MPKKAKENEKLKDKDTKTTKTTNTKTKSKTKTKTNSTTTKKETASKKTTSNKNTKKKTATTKKQVKKAVVEYYDLPQKYNQTIVKILAQTPKTLFIYWEISDDDITKYKNQYGEDFFETTIPVLIIHNDTLNYSFEVEINDFALPKHNHLEGHVIRCSNDDGVYIVGCQMPTDDFFIREYVKERLKEMNG